MPNNNPRHRRNQRMSNSLVRHKGNREPYNKVLIVCEGQVTEPNYFNGLIQHYKINSANVRITGKGGSSPKSVVELAEKIYNEEEEEGDAFDKVFCVFDKDNYKYYKETLNGLSSMKPANIFVAITSVPAFEYWLLLHYEYSTKPYKTQQNGQSAGVQVLSDLKKHFPRYTKSHTNVFVALKDKLETAINNAECALKVAEKTDTDNPSTKVHELVGFLQNIKS